MTMVTRRGDQGDDDDGSDSHSDEEEGNGLDGDRHP